MSECSGVGDTGILYLVEVQAHCPDLTDLEECFSARVAK